MNRSIKRESNGSPASNWIGGHREDTASALLDASFLQQALENRADLGGRDALHAMALAAAAHAAATARANGVHSDDQEDEEEDRVEDLSVGRKSDSEQPGVIVKKEDALREYQDENRRVQQQQPHPQPVDCGDRD